MRYLLLIVEPRGQRETRSEEEGRALYAEMVRFGEGLAARVPFEVPRGEALAARLASVLEVVCLIFNEGYAATTGDDWVRPALCQEALRLGRIIAGLMPLESGVHGLVALMEIQASRLHARVAPRGSPSCCSTRTAPAGIICSFVVAWLRSNAPKRWPVRSAPMASRPRSPPATRARPVPSRPTGPASLRCTTRSPSLPHRRWWSSIAPWPSPWRSAPQQDCRSSTPCSPNPPSRPTTYCPACIAQRARQSARPAGSRA